MTPNDLDIHRPGEDPLAGQLCDVCDKKKEKAKVYCVSCPKKLCKEHEQVSVRYNCCANPWHNKAKRWFCLDSEHVRNGSSMLH